VGERERRKKDRKGGLGQRGGGEIHGSKTKREPAPSPFTLLHPGAAKKLKGGKVKEGELPPKMGDKAAWSGKASNSTGTLWESSF